MGAAIRLAVLIHTAHLEKTAKNCCLEWKKKM